MKSGNLLSVPTTTCSLRKPVVIFTGAADGFIVHSTISNKPIFCSILRKQSYLKPDRAMSKKLTPKAKLFSLGGSRPNDQRRMTNDERNPKRRMRNQAASQNSKMQCWTASFLLHHSTFGFLSSFVIRYSSFGPGQTFATGSRRSRHMN